MEELQLLKRKLDREREARKQAESILETKAMELHQANHELIELNENLEQAILDRTIELEQSEKRYRQIIEHAEDFIFRTDPDGYFTYINPVANKKLGYSSEEVIGSHFTKFVLPGYADELMQMYIDRRDNKKVNTYQELPIVSKDGDITWVGQNVQFIVENGEIKEVAGVARDISERKIAEDALMTTQLRLTSLITNLHSGVLVENENRKVVLANKLLCKLLKIPLTPKELEGTDCKLSAIRSKHLFKNPDKFVRRIDELLAKKEMVIGEEVHMADGKILERDYVPIWDGRKYMGHLWQYRDITEEYHTEEKLRRSEEKYRGIIENMELGLMEVDTEETIVKVYDWFCGMTGYTQEEIIGKNAIEVFLPEEYTGELTDQNVERKKGRTGVYEVQMKRKDGSLIWVLISGAPIHDDKGGVVGSIGIHYDITDRKNMEHDLEKAKQVAEEAELAEKQFLARMSHEIRTPLNAIIGMSHLMEDTILTEEQKDYVDSLKSSSDILQKLISDILDLSKITAGGLEVHHRTFDLVGAIKSLQKTFKLKLTGSPVTITADIDDGIKTLMIGDDLLLNQILLNLLGNAVKFTEQGEIRLKVEQQKSVEEKVELKFTVSDTGIGISPDRIDAIFENFKQADNEIRFQFGGTGLGLAIAKQLVELQGGQIFVSSVEGQGTDFVFKIIYEDSGQLITEVSRKETEKIDLNIANVLVAEDNFMNRKYVAALFAKWGLKYEFAVNGRKAVEAASREKFDLILMDISMPEMNGYDATIQIRNTANPNQNTPIIALTASAMISKKDKAYEVGMSDYLAKPFRPKQLKSLIHKFNRKDDSSIDIDEAVEEEGFKHNEVLNTKHLEYLYKGDLDYASEMFEIFISYTMEEYKKLRPLLEEKEIEKLQHLAHKIKPNFSLVGLTEVEKLMLELEKNAEAKISIAELDLLLLKIDEQVKLYQPIIVAELEKMKTLI